LCNNKKHWRAREKKGPRATLVDSIFIKEFEEDKVLEEHFVEAYAIQKDTREDNVVEAKVYTST
jgi:hypothetical protein